MAAAGANDEARRVDLLEFGAPSHGDCNLQRAAGHIGGSSKFRTQVVASKSSKTLQPVLLSVHRHQQEESKSARTAPPPGSDEIDARVAPEAMTSCSARRTSPICPPQLFSSQSSHSQAIHKEESRGDQGDASGEGRWLSRRSGA